MNSSFAVVYDPSESSQFEVSITRRQDLYVGELECTELTYCEYKNVDPEELDEDLLRALVKVYSFDRTKFEEWVLKPTATQALFCYGDQSWSFSTRELTSKSLCIPSVEIFRDAVRYRNIDILEPLLLENSESGFNLDYISPAPEILRLYETSVNIFKFCDPSKLKSIVLRNDYIVLTGLYRNLKLLSEAEGRDVFKSLVSLELPDYDILRLFLENFDIEELDFLYLEKEITDKDLEASVKLPKVKRSDTVCRESRPFNYREAFIGDCYLEPGRSGIEDLGVVDARLYRGVEFQAVVNVAEDEIDPLTAIRATIKSILPSSQKSARKVVR